MKITVGILNKKQTLALFKPGSAKHKMIAASDKEYYTEVEDLMEPRPTFPAGTRHQNGAPNARL